METNSGISRWSMSPVHKGSDRDRRPWGQQRGAVAPWRSTPAQNQHRYASRAHRWRWPELICARVRESPCGKAWSAWRRDRPGYRAGSHDRSVAQKPWPETDPNKRSRANWHRHNSGIHTFEALCGAAIRSAARRWCGPSSCTIVSPPPGANKIDLNFKSSPSRVPASYSHKRRYWILRKNSRTAVILFHAPKTVPLVVGGVK